MSRSENGRRIWLWFRKESDGWYVFIEPRNLTIGPYLTRRETEIAAYEVW